MSADGLAILDKPAGMTSHDVVSRFRRIAGTRRVGHAGTLDPMATGVLVLAVGQATRLLRFLELGDKQYLAGIRLGQATTTDDAEGEVLRAVSAAGVSEADVRAAIAPLTGDILQVPSSVSAIKVDGQRAYKRVRDGESVQLAARPVTVHRFDIDTFTTKDKLVDVQVDVECSSGTYVRALARDLGGALGVGGHLVSLRRVRVGRFTIAQARTLDELASADRPVMVPMADAARTAMPVRTVSADEATELSFGRSLAASGIAGAHAAIGPDGALVAILVDGGSAARPVLVLAARG
jgi:tRNA pseudouridine55 synthase